MIVTSKKEHIKNTQFSVSRCKGSCLENYSILEKILTNLAQMYSVRCDTSIHDRHRVA